MMTADKHNNPGTDYIDLSALLQSLLEKKWLILGTSFAVFVFAMAYTLCKPKKYQATLLLEIHQSQRQQADSPAQGQTALEGLPEQTLAMHLALLRSKFILLPVIHSLGLNLKPRKLPESLIFNKMQAALAITDLSGSNEALGSHAGIIQVGYLGENPEQITKILNEIARVAQQKNIAYKIQAIENKIAFLKGQLPVIKQSLQETEAQFNAYQSNSRKMNIQLQSRYLSEQISDLDKQVEDLRLKKSLLLQQYTMQYPFVQALSQKIKALERQRLQIYGDLKKLPAEDQAALAILREMKLKNKLYLTLFNQIHELEVAKAGMMSDIRVLVPATPPDLSLSIRLSLIGIGSSLLGFLLGCFLVLVWKIFARRIEDPDWTENYLGIQNLATVPYRRSNRSDTEEALCYLCTYLQLRQSPSQKIISLAGLTPGVGKTFIIAQLAELLAKMNKKTLLIDANFHQSNLQHYFSAVFAPGLSELLQDQTSLSAALVQPTNLPALHFLPAGNKPSQPLDLLSSQRFKNLLNETAAQYQFILINSATARQPSDCAYLGSLAAMNLLVIGKGCHRANEIALAMKRLQQLGLQIHGSIFNQVKPQEPLPKVLRRKFFAWRGPFDTKIKQSALECPSVLKRTGD